MKWPRALVVMRVTAGLCLLATQSVAAAEIDHIILVVPALEAYVADFTEQTGIEPTFGGAHSSLGTANYLVSLGAGAYLEILGPDPKADSLESLGEILARLEQPGLAWFALRTDDVEATLATLEEAGLDPLGPSPGSRKSPSGLELHWQAVLAGGHAFGDFVPFFIDWQESPHPSDTSAGGLRLVSLRVHHPEFRQLNEIYRKLGMEEIADGAPEAGWEAHFESERGSLILRNPYEAQIFAPLMGPVPSTRD